MRTPPTTLPKLYYFAALSLGAHVILFLPWHPATPYRHTSFGTQTLQINLAAASSQPLAGAARGVTQPVQKIPWKKQAQKTPAIHTMQKDVHIALAETSPQTPTPASADQTRAQTPAGSTASEAEQNFVLGKIQTLLSRHLIYPYLARQRGWEGKVVLRFRLQKSGKIDDIKVSKSSGYTLLDRAALKALNAAGQETVAGLQGYELELQIPVIYRLQEG